MKISDILEDTIGQAGAQALGGIAAALRGKSVNPVEDMLRQWDNHWNKLISKDPSVRKGYGIELQKFIATEFSPEISKKLDIKRTVSNGRPNGPYIKSFFAQAIKQKPTKDPADLTAIWPIGTIKKGSDGQDYKWLGAQWQNVKNGQMAGAKLP